MLRTDAIGVEADEVMALATAGCLFGAPLVAMDLIRRAHPSPCACFTLVSRDGAALAPGLPRDADPDLVVASAWLDLADGPLVLSLPGLHGRYAVINLSDAWGRRLASLGSRTGGADGRDVAVVGPEWRGELTGRLSAVRSPSQGAWVTLQLWAHGEADREPTRDLLRRFFIAPLTHPSDRDERAPADPIQPVRTLDEALAGMPATVFFHRLAGLLAVSPPARESRPALEALARLGVVPGKPFETLHWPEANIAALQAGLEAGLAGLASTCNDIRAGWRPGEPGPDAHRLATLGASAREDVLNLVAEADENGRPLDGSHRYQVVFAPGETPPAEASWRLDVLDESGAPAAVDYGRPGLGDRGPILWNPDHSLVVPVQRRRPSRDPSNWLVAPTGRFALRLRICWPRGCALSGLWSPPRLVDLGPARGVATVFTAGTRRRPRLAAWRFAEGEASIQGGLS